LNIGIPVVINPGSNIYFLYHSFLGYIMNIYMVLCDMFKRLIYRYCTHHIFDTSIKIFKYIYRHKL